MFKNLIFTGGGFYIAEGSNGEWLIGKKVKVFGFNIDHI